MATSTLAFSGAQDWAELLCNSCVIGGPQNRGQNHTWLRHPCLLKGPRLGGIAPCARVFSGVPQKGDNMRSGYINPAFSEFQDWAELLRNHCVLRHPQKRGTKSQVATSLLPSREPKSGRSSDKLVHSRGSLEKGVKITSGYINPAFSGAQDWAELIRNPVYPGFPRKRDKITSGYITPPSRGPKIGRNHYVTPVVLGVPEKRGQNHKWLHHPCLLGGTRLGGIAT